MRISDWSSDVCSSDLLASVTGKPAEPLDIRGAMQDGNLQAMGAAIQDRMDTIAAVRGAYGPGVQVHPLLPQESKMLANARSEEHTSELQSVMRISYAVFCLKKTQKYND